MGFIRWHKRLTDKFMEKSSPDWYDVAWIAWFKGVVAGLII